MKPPHLYWASRQVCDEQFAYDKGARDLMHALSGKEECAGKGADVFATAYAEVAALFLQVWGKSVVSVGGVAVGLTVTANNYVAADWYTDKKQYGPPPRTQPPAVITTPPHYGTAADLKWRGTGADSSSAVVRITGHVPDFIADVTQGAVDQALRLGKLYEITPGAHAYAGQLHDVAGAWRQAGTAALKSGDSLTGTVGHLTDKGNGEWQQAMNMFCQSVWGTTPYGGTRYGHGQDWRTNPGIDPKDRRPILTVLNDTAVAVAKACEDLVAAAATVTDIAQRAAVSAARAMLEDTLKSMENPLRDLLDLSPVGAEALTAQMVMSFRSHMDYAGVNHAVEAYLDTCGGIATTLKDLVPALEEASLSAPTFNAEEARAEGYGSRSLNEFKNEHLPWDAHGDSSGAYPISLDGEEWLDGAHTLDRHVGLTDAQLVQRLRDDLKKPPRAGWPAGQPKIPSASSFTDFASAQLLTQYCIDCKQGDIDAWLYGDPSKASDEFEIPDTPYGVTGRGVDKADFKAKGLEAPVHDDYGVKMRLIRAPGLVPPFIVSTSMPWQPES
ncbi:RNase A-like domain-containing protein [Streptantibioticus parmotrematis]|uniref:RNase A-like domain-containing protein n=1 Tax=Streptantibioticus parmotrematis TaxID=2873249 RepID=UPI0033E5EEAE